MLSRFDLSAETLQRYADAAASSVGAVTGIVMSALSDITDELGSLATELLEIRQSPVRDDD
jgi:hypothetical protein